MKNGLSPANTESALAALVPYGATLDERGFICRKGKSLGVYLELRRGRWYFRQYGGVVLGSGTIEKFVESFWFWKTNKETDA